MEENLDLRIFDHIRRLGRRMRAGRMPGMMFPWKAETVVGSSKPAMQRELTLAILYRNRGCLRQRELAEEIFVSPSTLSEMIDRLEGDGLVIRRIDPRDRRVYQLALTQDGEARAREIEAAQAGFFARLFGKLNEDEKRQLIGLLEKLDPGVTQD